MLILMLGGGVASLHDPPSEFLYKAAGGRFSMLCVACEPKWRRKQHPVPTLVTCSQHLYKITPSSTLPTRGF